MVSVRTSIEPPQTSPATQDTPLTTQQPQNSSSQPYITTLPSPCSAPNGTPLWISDVMPGPVHDLTAAREQVLDALYWAAAHLELP